MWCLIAVPFFAFIYCLPRILESQAYRVSKTRQIIHRMIGAMHPEDKAMRQAWSVQRILRQPGLTPEDTVAKIRAVFAEE